MKKLKLKYLIDLKKGKNPSAFLDKGEIPYLTMDYLRNRDKNIKYVKDKNKLVVVRENEILILWDGANAGEIIKSKKGVVSSTMAVVSSRNKCLDNNFLYYSLKNIETILKDFSSGTTIPHLDTNKLLHSSFFIPSLKIQTAIANYLDRKTAEIDELIADKERLLELYEEEKTAIINQAVTKGINPNVPMKDSGIEWLGDIPEHWEVKKLKYVVDLITEKSNGELQKVGLENIESNSGDFIEANSEFQGEGIRFIFGDILYGKLRPYLAKVFLCEFEGAAVGDFFVLRSKENYLPEFIKYRLLSTSFTQISNSSTYGAKMPRVSWEFMSQLFFALPNENEQLTITEYIKSEIAGINSKSKKVEGLLELLKEYKQSLISEVVTGKIKVTE